MIPNQQKNSSTIKTASRPKLSLTVQNPKSALLIACSKITAFVSEKSVEKCFEEVKRMMVLILKLIAC